MQRQLFQEIDRAEAKPFRTQLLKWIGNKQRFAHEIVAHLPSKYSTYFEPFLGSGAVLGTLGPKKGIGSDRFEPLIQIWQTLMSDSEKLKRWYTERWELMNVDSKAVVYDRIRASYNATPNPADLLYLCRSCYGGVVRFRQRDGFMSTPCGVHLPVPPSSFAKRVDLWRQRCQNSKFLHADYLEVMRLARRGDVIYCDPPYVDSQSILYGAQAFDLAVLMEEIAQCKARGVYVALSIDGTKRSGEKQCQVTIPEGLFKREVYVNCGRSMLRRFQLRGKSLEHEIVADRLLLTY